MIFYISVCHESINKILKRTISYSDNSVLLFIKLCILTTSSSCNSFNTPLLLVNLNINNNNLFKIRELNYPNL
jgi:hypothetical protein